MDALLPIKRQARAYEAAVNNKRIWRAQYRLYEVQNGNHIESYAGLFPQLVAIQPHAQKAFDLLVDAVEANAPLPPSQCIPTGATISPSPSQPGHCANLFVPSRNATPVHNNAAMAVVDPTSVNWRNRPGAAYRLTPRGD